MTQHAHNFIDLSGKKFGRWRVVARSSEETLDDRGKKMVGCSKMRSARWQCVCECGAIREVNGEKLRAGKSKSCGCINAKDLSGRQFGTWKVKTLARDPEGNLVWLCRCAKTGIVALFERVTLMAKNTPPCLADLTTPDKVSSRAPARFGSWKLLGCGDQMAKSRDGKRWIVAKGYKKRELYQCLRSGWHILVEPGEMTKENPLPSPADWEPPRPSNAVDYTGEIFGTWKALEHVGIAGANRLAVWRCECQKCGRMHEMNSVRLQTLPHCSCKEVESSEPENKKPYAEQATTTA